jgi:hypothetical protein
MGERKSSTIRDARDLDMANVSENLSDLGDKTSGAPGGNIQGGSGGTQGHADQAAERDSRPEAHEESRAGRRGGKSS